MFNKKTKKRKEFEREQKLLKNRDLLENNEKFLQELENNEEIEKENDIDFSFKINIIGIIQGILFIIIGLYVYDTFINVFQEIIYQNTLNDSSRQALYQTSYSLLNIVKPLIIGFGSLKIIMGLLGSNFKFNRYI